MTVRHKILWKEFSSSRKLKDDSFSTDRGVIYTIHMDIPDKDRFRMSLMSVSEGLSHEDLLQLIHLCRDVIKRKEAESISTGYELFEMLEERGKLSPDYLWYLADLLLLVNQNCLLDHIGLGNIPESDHRARRCQVTPYRQHLTKLAMDMDDKDFQALKSACDCNKEDVTDFYELVLFLEGYGKISPKTKVGVGFLLQAFEKAGLTTEGNGNIPLLVSNFKDQMEKEEYCYRMTSKPKGICVIINNVEFPNKEQRRVGSKVDADRLSRLFKKFSFKVERHNDLKSNEMVSVLQGIARRDQWRYDCLIICVLSHGSLGRVFGIDDVAVEIQKLLDIFSIRNCPSLEGKPKVFFFQACQGPKYEEGLSRPLSASSGCEADACIDDNAPSVNDMEPDLLLGYATPPGFRSFRHSHGSWYIEELVNSLKIHAATEDILSVLTHVNNEVMEKVGTYNNVSVKQTPCPTFTLAKKLYLAEKSEIF